MFAWLAAGAAWADEAEETAAFIQFDVPIELQLDITGDPSLSDLYVTIEPSATVMVASWLRLEFGATFEPVEDATDDRVFEDHGLYVNAALAVVSLGQVTVQAGKLSPHFSVGFEYAPGLHGDALNGDLEIAERLALAASFNLMGEGTSSGVVISGVVLRRDTTVLSDSAFTSRGQLRVSDGGPGNHDGFESFGLAVDAVELEALPGVHLHAAYLRQAGGAGDTTDAQAWVLAANWMIEASEAATYQLLVEWARSWDALGFGDAVSIPGAEQDLVTLAASGTWDETWTGAVLYGWRRSDDPGAGVVEETLLQLTAGYAVSDDLSVEAGWQTYDDGADSTQTYSMRLASGFEYAIE